MAIDFRLTTRQRELQLQSRKFAREVLAPALEAEALPTPEDGLPRRGPLTRRSLRQVFCGSAFRFPPGERALVSPTRRSWSRSSTR